MRLFPGPPTELVLRSAAETINPRFYSERPKITLDEETKIPEQRAHEIAEEVESKSSSENAAPELLGIHTTSLTALRSETPDRGLSRRH